MEQNLVQKAIVEAMQDPKVIAVFAESVSRKIIDQKSKTTDDESFD